MENKRVYIKGWSALRISRRAIKLMCQGLGARGGAPREAVQRCEGVGEPRPLCYGQVVSFVVLVFVVDGKESL